MELGVHGDGGLPPRCMVPLTGKAGLAYSVHPGKPGGGLQPVQGFPAAHGAALSSGYHDMG